MDTATIKRDSRRVAAGLLALMTVVGRLWADEQLSATLPISFNYTSSAGWQMDATVTPALLPYKVFLKFAVDATPSSGPCSAGTTLSNV
jgi:hypothetical protein